MQQYLGLGGKLHVIKRYQRKAGNIKSESAYKAIKYHCLQQDNEEKDNIHKP
jgi:hypothetical protein